MLDVIHYIFEADLAEQMTEYAEMKDTYRTRIYEDFYNQKYLYASTSNKNKTFDPNLPPIDEPLNQASSSGFEATPSAMTKGYIPPTKISEDTENPYEGVLDAPLN